MDGNAEQARAIASQLADAVFEKLRGELPTHKDIEALKEKIPTEADIDERITQAFVVVENKLNKKLLGVLLANAAALVGVAFLLGGLWVKFSGVPQVLEGRGVWIRSTEIRLQALESWATKQGGYEPPPPMVLPE